MSDVEYERGRTLTYPTMYPRLLITPVFAHKGDFMWVESIVCKYDSDIDDIEEPEFEFVRSTVHSESNDALKAENAKLLELIRDYDKCLDTALYLAGKAGYSNMPDGHLFESLNPRMRELGVEVSK